MSDYKRILNTHNFTYTGSSDVRGDAGVRTNFNFQIPAIPALPNGESKTAILTIKSFFIGEQTQADNVVISDFFLQIGGLSIRPTLHTAISGGLLAINRISIPNSTPHTLNPAGAFASISTLSGSELNTPIEVICGNPSGNQFTLNIVDEDGDPIVANAGNLANLLMSFSFSIELIDPDDDQNF